MHARLVVLIAVLAMCLLAGRNFSQSEAHRTVDMVLVPRFTAAWAEWMIGGVVDALTTDASQLYIDDAAMAKRRLGPTAPFTRE